MDAIQKYLLFIPVFAFNSMTNGQTLNLGLEYHHFNKYTYVDSPFYEDISSDNIISGNSMAASGEFWKGRWSVRLGLYYSVLNLNLHGRYYSAYYYDAYSGSATRENFYYKSAMRLGGVDLCTSVKILGGNAQKTYSKYFSLMFDLGLNTETLLGSKTLLDTDTIVYTAHTGHYPTSPYPGSSYTQVTISPATDKVKIIKATKVYLHLGPRARFYFADKYTLDMQFGFRFINEQYFSRDHIYCDKNDFYYGFRLGYRFKIEKGQKASLKNHRTSS